MLYEVITLHQSRLMMSSCNFFLAIFSSVYLSINFCARGMPRLKIVQHASFSLVSWFHSPEQRQSSHSFSSMSVVVLRGGRGLVGSHTAHTASYIFSRSMSAIVVAVVWKMIVPSMRRVNCVPSPASIWIAWWKQCLRSSCSWKAKRVKPGRCG